MRNIRRLIACCGTCPWRVLELRDNAETNRTLGQFVYGTQYIDEPICYDRDTDGDDDCLEAEGSRRYFYHQDANYRVAALTDEDGFVVERYEYDAYGEPVVYNGGTSSELGNALPASTVGNPLMHQGLWRDLESASYQNRYRQYASALGRFGQRDPLGYVDGMNLLEYQRAASLLRLDALGQCSKFLDDPTAADYDIDKERGRLRRHQIQSEDAMKSVLNTGASIVLIIGTATVEVCVQSVCIAIPAEWLALQGIKVVGNTLIRADKVLSSTEVVAIVKKYANNIADDDVKKTVEGALKKAQEALAARAKEEAISSVRVTEKIIKQMEPRSWTAQQIGEAIKSGQQIPGTNKATGNAAIRYVHPETGQSVVVDTVTNEVIHVGGPGFKYGPASGDLP